MVSQVVTCVLRYTVSIPATAFSLHLCYYETKFSAEFNIYSYTQKISVTKFCFMNVSAH